MQSKASIHHRNVRSPISALMLCTISAIASFYVAGRLWQDAEDRVYFGKELDRITGQGKSAISVDDTLKIIGCREQQKKLTALEMELAAARQEGFVSKHPSTTKTSLKKRPLVVIGVLTGFGRKSNREVIRKAWMSTGEALRKMEDQKGVIARFVIGRSANRGDSLDRGIDIENRNYNDFFILDSHVEATEELPKKTKFFFALAAERWEAEYYAKVNDDVYVNIDALGSTLAAHLDSPRVYIGCMKSGKFSLNRVRNGMNRIGGNLGMGRRISGMHLVKCLLYPRPWRDLSQLTDLFSAHTLLMMSAPVPGSSVLMSNILMTESSAVHLGQQEVFAQARKHNVI